MTSVYSNTNEATDSLAATGNGTAFKPTVGRPFNAQLSGTWVGTMILNRSLDGGTTYVACSKPDLSDASFTANVSFQITPGEAGEIYRWSFTRTSGTAVARLSQSA